MPFKFKPRRKPAAGRSKKTELAKHVEHTSTWSQIRAPLIASIAERTLEGMYESLIDAASLADDSMDAWSGLQLIRWWWWPARSRTTGAAAATWLQAWIRHELEMAEEYYSEKAAAAPAGAKRTEYERRAGILSRLASDPSFAAPVIAEMASYDPREDRQSPYRTLSKILEKKLTPILGGGLGPRRPKPTDLGREIARLFDLPDDDPARKRLEWCLLKLGSDERALFRLRYRDDVKHEAVQGQKKWSDRKINDVRKRAVDNLLSCMPQLIVFWTPDRKN